jgi:purine catabolism regulator
MIVMGLTVAQALEIGALRRGRILAGQAGLSRLVEHVSVLEIPMPENPHWIHGNELYITAFFVIRSDRQGQLRTIDVMARRQVAGLVYQPTPDGTLYPEVLELAERRAFPIIEIPIDLAYIEIITPIMARIFELRSQTLERASTLHRRFIGRLLEGHGLQSLVEMIYGLLGRPVLLTSDYAPADAAAGLDPASQARWRQLLYQAAPTYATTLQAGEEQLLVRPLIGSGRCLGWLAARHDARFDQDDALIIEQAATTITLELIKQEAIIASQRGKQDELLARLLAGRFVSDDQLLSEARQAGWNVQPCRAVLVIQAARSSARGELLGPSFSPFQIVTRFLQRSHPASIACQYGDEILVLAALPEEPGQAQDGLRQLGQALYELLSADERLRRVLVASGGYARTPLALATSYAEALRTLQLRGQMAEAPPVMSYADVRPWILLGEFYQQPEVQAWLRDQVGALLDYDRRNKTAFLQTLEVALDHGGALNAAAEALSVHPNTLKYRLQRIEEILEHNPFESRHRLAFHLACRLVRLARL